ncbi:hypothetical protein AMTR_s00065p00048910, partial [Amborella trichopoda]
DHPTALSSIGPTSRRLEAGHGKEVATCGGPNQGVITTPMVTGLEANAPVNIVAAAVEVGPRTRDNLLPISFDVVGLAGSSIRQPGANRGTASFDSLQESLSRKWGHALLCFFCEEILEFSPTKLAAVGDSTREVVLAETARRANPTFVRREKACLTQVEANLQRSALQSLEACRSRSTAIAAEKAGANETLIAAETSLKGLHKSIAELEALLATKSQEFEAATEAMVEHRAHLERLSAESQCPKAESQELSARLTRSQAESEAEIVAGMTRAQQLSEEARQQVPWQLGGFCQWLQDWQP